MSIASSDIELRLSNGGTTNPNTDPLHSLGGTISYSSGAPSSGKITTGLANNLWDDVTGAESAAGYVDFRAVYIRNAHGSITWQGVSFWFDALPSGSAADAALASEAVNTAISQTLSTRTTAPSSVTFGTRPTAKNTSGFVIGDIPAGQFKGIWLRRTVSAGASALADAMSVRAEGDSGP